MPNETNFLANIPKDKLNAVLELFRKYEMPEETINMALQNPTVFRMLLEQINDGQEAQYENL